MKLKNNKGFTLIELIIALSIVSILSLTFFNIMSSSIKYNTKNEKDIKALNIAQSEIENLRKEIKLSESEITINIKDSNNEDKMVMIPDDDQIIWKEVEGNKDLYTIEINESSEDYSEHIANNLDGTKDFETLQYIRTLEGDKTPYIVKLKLTRSIKNNKFLYNIEVRVKSLNENISNKETILNTSILSK